MLIILILIFIIGFIIGLLVHSSNKKFNKRVDEDHAKRLVEKLKTTNIVNQKHISKEQIMHFLNDKPSLEITFQGNYMLTRYVDLDFDPRVSREDYSAYDLNIDDLKSEYKELINDGYLFSIKANYYFYTIYISKAKQETPYR